MALVILGPGDYRSMPWANGRGTTLELAREDRDGRMLWRLSKADVTEPGPFSLLPGIDRTLTLIEGAGFDLDLGENGGIVPALPWRPLRFAGEWPVAACNLCGPSRDLNLMLDRERAAGDVTVHRRGASVEAAPWSLFLAAAGQWSVTAGDAHAGLPVDCLAIVSGRAGQPTIIAGDGILIAAHIRLRAA